MIKGFDLFLCGFTLVIVMTSISKILLYIAEYGLTHKRLYVFVADIILVVAFAMVTVRFFKKYGYSVEQASSSEVEKYKVNATIFVITGINDDFSYLDSNYLTVDFAVTYHASKDLSF